MKTVISVCRNLRTKMKHVANALDSMLGSMLYTHQKIVGEGGGAIYIVCRDQAQKLSGVDNSYSALRICSPIDLQLNSHYSLICRYNI